MELKKQKTPETKQAPITTNENSKMKISTTEHTSGYLQNFKQNSPIFNLSNPEIAKKMLEVCDS